MEKKGLKHTKLLSYDTVEVVFGLLKGFSNNGEYVRDLNGLYTTDEFILTKGFLIRDDDLFKRNKILLKVNQKWYTAGFFEEYEVKTTRLVLIEKMINKDKIKHLAA